MIFSPTLVVSKNKLVITSLVEEIEGFEEYGPAAGPAPSFADRPNFDHCFLSATRGLTTSL